MNAAESVNRHNSAVMASLTSFYFRQRMADEDMHGRHGTLPWAEMRSFHRAAAAKARRYVYGR